MGMTFDCLIVGAGPAGLTAAIYLGRYMRNVLVADDGPSRAALIPTTHNYPGFPAGIAGGDLLAALRKQAEAYGATFRGEKIVELQHTAGLFVAKSFSNEICAKNVVLASGLVDRTLNVPGLDEAIAAGLVRYCPVCDGYEARDMKICVLGSGEDALHKALFLRTYSAQITLVWSEKSPDPRWVDEASQAGIRSVTELIQAARCVNESVEIKYKGGRVDVFNVLYPALGCQVRSELASRLGAECNDVGCLKVDEFQHTTVKGIYAVGDVVSDLHQLAVGAGHGAIAATHIHKMLPRNFRREMNT